MAKKPLKFKDFNDVDYTGSGDDQISSNAQRRKTEETETEALNMAQRMKMSRSFKKNKAKIAMGRKRAANKMANMDTLKKRAKKAARNFMLKKITKDVPKDELSMSRRQDIEKRLDKLKPKIDKLAKKMIPQVRKKEIERKRGKKSD